MLGWQVGELSDLAFDLDDWRALNQEQARLAHAASLIEGGTEVVEGLADGVYMVKISNNKGLNYSQTIRKN